MAVYSWILANGVTDNTCSIYIAKNEACTPEDICRNCDPYSGCFAVKEYKTVSHTSSVVSWVTTYVCFISSTSVNMVM